MPILRRSDCVFTAYGYLSCCDCCDVGVGWQAVCTMWGRLLDWFVKLGVRGVGQQPAVGQITICSENKVWPPEDGRKDAQNMFRNNWLTIKLLIVASSWSHIYLLQFSAFATSTLGGGEWSASRPDRFTLIWHRFSWSWNFRVAFRVTTPLPPCLFFCYECESSEFLWHFEFSSRNVLCQTTAGPVLLPHSKLVKCAVWSAITFTVVLINP